MFCRKPYAFFYITVGADAKHTVAALKLSFGFFKSLFLRNRNRIGYALFVFKNFAHRAKPGGIHNLHRVLKSVYKKPKVFNNKFRLFPLRFFLFQKPVDIPNRFRSILTGDFWSTKVTDTDTKVTVSCKGLFYWHSGILIWLRITVKIGKLHLVSLLEMR